ncbi:MAG: hypothetical protein KJ955_07250 [Nanoarchaeota archaeon]|nr:hypothetical protein [Nanoarchaeota archaeon]
MKPYSFFVGEEYNRLPDFLKRQVDEIGLSCRHIIAESGTKLDKGQSIAFLKEIKKILLLALEFPENINKEMVSGIGTGIIGVDIKFVPECEEAIKELIDAETKGDITSFLHATIAKIDAVLAKLKETP